MKIKLFSMLTLMMVAFASVSLSSCSKEDPKIVINPDDGGDDDDGDDGDVLKYTVVGTWKAVYYWQYSRITETIVMNIKSDGSLSFVETFDDGREPFVGEGTWQYVKSTKKWKLLTGDSMISGEYSLKGDQFVNYQLFNDGSSRAIVFERNYGSEDSTTDYSKYLPGQWEYYSEQLDGTPIWISFHFDKNGAGTIAFYDEVDQDWGITAYGTYTLKGNTISAYYNNVTVEDENYNHVTYHGFTHGKSKNVTYTILSCDSKKLNIKDDSGTTFNLEK